MRTKPIPALLAILTAVTLAACGGDDGNSDGNGTSGQEGPAAGQTTTARETGESQTAPQPEPDTIVVRSGEPAGGPEELEYEAGDRVDLRVRSDVADEVHVHGYDLSKEVPAGGTITLSFTADIEGIFEIELEERGEQIAELRVNP